MRNLSNDIRWERLPATRKEKPPKSCEYIIDAMFRKACSKQLSPKRIAEGHIYCPKHTRVFMDFKRKHGEYNA